ncbi:MAG: TonB-dependent receptor plug domain-containing protein [Deltaproteobacteria bacterium]|nr:TonB-dependent receptor plug domain-containing protein [Nannocystaceae bacterium]
MMLRNPRCLALVLGALAWLPCAVAQAEEPADPCASVRCLELRGVVRRSGDRVPIASARVLVVPERSARKPGDVPTRDHLRPEDPPAWVRSGSTDEQGAFAIADVPPGRVRVVVIGDGLARRESIIVTTAKQRPIFVQPLSASPFRTVVKQPQRTTAATTSTSLSQEEIATLPGTQGDPLRAVQSLPGVGRSPGGLGMLVLRGAAPNQSRVFYGEHPIPRAFHVLGFTSVLQADVLEGLEVQPSNFGARWGNASGGVVLLHPRRGRRDGVHGHAKIDLISASALVEGRLGRKGSYIVAAQRGYVDAVLRVAERIDPTAVFALPRYFDYQGQYDRDLSGGGQLTVRLIGSGDRWKARYFQGGRRIDGYELSDQFHRAEVVHARDRGRWRTLVTPAFRFDNATTESELADSKRRTYVVSWRAEAEHRFTQRFSLTLGTDAIVAPFQVKSQSMEFNASAPAERTIRGHDTSIGLYANATLRLGGLTLWPGVRLSAFSRRANENTGVDRSAKIAFDPRVLARWDVARRWSLHGGFGAYSQPDGLTQSGSSGIFSSGELAGGRVVLPAALQQALDPGIGSAGLNDIVDVYRAWHGSLGFEWTSRFGLSVRATAFARWLQVLESYVLQGTRRVSAAPFTTEQHARNYGGELLVRQRISNKLYAWVGYTLMRSDYRNANQASALGPVRPSEYDQRHNLVVLASYALPHDFRIGGRFRVVTGTPYTPVVGTVINEFGAFPVGGEINSSRFPVFHQLDVRLDRTWYRKRTTWTAYVDVQNVYNHQNVEALIYAGDFRSIVGNLGLPIFPSLGIRLDW